MNINGTIDKTFFNAELHTPKKITAKIVRLAEKQEQHDDNFYSNFLKKIKDEDVKAPRKPRKSDQCGGNILNFQGQTSSKEICTSSRKSMDVTVMNDEEASRTSNLHPRKLKRESNGNAGSNMILMIPGMGGQGQQEPKKKNSSIFGHNHRKSSNISNINLKELRETTIKDPSQEKRDKEEEDNMKSGRNIIINETVRSNASNVLKIMIPSGNEFKAFEEEEEERKLEIQENIITVEVIGIKQPPPMRNFLFDSLKIQKLNSIKELGTKRQDNEELQKSMVILNQMKGNKIPDHRLQAKESQIIIINQNEFNRFPSDKAATKPAKSSMLCCIPVK